MERFENVDPDDNYYQISRLAKLTASLILGQLTQ